MTEARLIGREEEQGRLRRALSDPAVDVVLLRGPAGSGKTALAQAALNEASRTGALTAAAGYAEGADDLSFGPVMRALSQFVDGALEQLYDPKTGMTSLCAAIGPALGVLVETGFRAEGLHVGAHRRNPLGRRDAAARVTAASLQLLRWLEGFGQPLVLFVDDWRRATPEVRQCLLALISHQGSPGLTLLLAERDGHPVDESLARLPVEQIGLQGLDHADRARLLGQALGNAEAGLAAAEWLGEDGPSLPFDLLETARTLRDGDALLQRDGVWTVEPTRASSLGRPASDAVRARLADLPEAARLLARAAALWGAPAPAEALQTASGLASNTFADSLQRLTLAGLVHRSEQHVRFSHDRLQEIVLAAVSKADAATLSAAMAERLSGTRAEPGDPAHTVSLHLRLSAGLDEADPGVWRDRFADGARAARSRADPASASVYAEAALALAGRAMPEDPGVRRSLLSEAVLAAADRRDDGLVLSRVRELLRACDSAPSVAQAYALGVVALRLAGDDDAAWAFALEGLGRFGVGGAGRDGPLTIAAAAARWQISRRLRGWWPHRRRAGVESLVPLAEAAGLVAYQRRSATAAILAAEMSASVRRSGVDSAYWHAIDAFVCAMVGDFEEAARLGNLAVATLDQLEGPRAATLYRALFFGVVWRRSMAALRTRSAEIRQMALAEGDFLTFGNALRNDIVLGWRTSPTLGALQVDVAQAGREAEWLHDPLISAWLESIDTALQAIRSPDADDRLRRRREAIERNPPVNALLEIELACLGGDWPAAQRVCALLRKSKGFFDNHPGGVLWRFYETLIRLKTGLPARRRDLDFVDRGARLSPEDHGAKPLLLRAEQLRRQGNRHACLRAYALAVEAARAGPSRLEAGLAAECAADAARQFGAVQDAQRYVARARAIWTEWGANWKVADLSGESRAAAVSPLLEEAEARAAAAQRADRAKSRLLADVAHELRTPLQGMQGLLDLAADGVRTADMPALRDVLASLRTVVDDLTEYGALSSGQVPLNLGPAPVRDIVRSEIRVAASLVASRTRDYVLAAGEDVPDCIETDAGRFRQVVRNLLSNAAKYGAGQVRVTLAREAGTAAGGFNLRLTVEDEGPGIPPGELQRLFEPFERGSEGQGHGLGLAVAQQLAQRLGGSLTASNRAEGGAAFRFSIPTRTVAPNPEAALPPPSLSVLVADDVPLIREVLTSVLEQDGHRVFDAADGREARDLLSAGRFDLALVDYRMPGMNGLEVLRGLRDAAHAPAVILLTASSDPGLAADAVAAGAAAVLRKPVSAVELRALIAELFGGRPSCAGVAPAPDFRAEAEAELRRQVTRLISAPRGGADRAEAAHRAAGLAAQFGWPQLAAACERLESACHDQALLGPALADLEAVAAATLSPKALARAIA